MLADECEKALAIMNRFELLLAQPVQSSMHRLCFDIGECTVDLRLLAKQLRERGKRITAIKETVKEQMDTSRNFWNTVLAFLVALYVPLSFASVSPLYIFSSPQRS